MYCALVALRFLAEAVAGVPYFDIGADAEPGIARNWLPQAPGAAAPSCASRRRHCRWHVWPADPTIGALFNIGIKEVLQVFFSTDLIRAPPLIYGLLPVLFPLFMP